MDIGEFFGNAAEQVKEGLNTLKEQALPAAQASAEKWAIEWLTEQNKKTQATVDANIEKLANSPPAPAGSFMAALQQTLGGSSIKAYGPQIILAVAGIGLFFYILGRKS